ncbi:hypothetical protein DRO41_00975 [Candidatus Bathyarchaeota archaeon]|nr:MAG: hypothetical protein DRO41_00975 [Candidatus Bathyarchaeota archaeon]
MGLDNYWVKNGKVFLLKFDPLLRVRGGMFSDPAHGSFRGEDYALLIKALSGLSLRSVLRTGTLRKISAALHRTSYSELPKYLRSDISEVEYEDLKRMFSKYVEVPGIRLEPWY